MEVCFMPVVYCIGEALIDFVPTTKGLSLEDVPSFVRAPGGAPANAAVAVSKLGGSSAFIGKVGQDAFGRLLKNTLSHHGVITDYMSTTTEANTTLAFVSLTADGDRDFIFYRKPGADMLLNQEDIPVKEFKKGDILHFCSLGLVDAPTKKAHKAAIETMKKAGGIISFDPNVRLDLWAEKQQCKQAILEYLPYADLVKVSLDEMPFIFDTEDEKEVAEKCFNLGIKAVIVTRGALGSAFYTQDYIKEVASIDVKVEDTTGAGDAYTGAVLSQIIKVGSLTLSQEQVDEIVDLANIAGSLTTTKKGGMESIPTLNEIYGFKKTNNC
jgi:fructokinase